MEWWKIVGIIVVLVVLFIIGYFFFQESPHKYYRKARYAHKKGEKSYATGNFEQAEALYAKAESHRKKAQELE